MIRRPPRSTLDRSSAASDVYKRQNQVFEKRKIGHTGRIIEAIPQTSGEITLPARSAGTVSYTHLRAHETVLDLVCRLLLEKKKTQNRKTIDEL